MPSFKHIQVRAEGSVEIWINNLLLCAREAVHCIIRWQGF